MSCSLSAPDGSVVTAWSQRVPPFQTVAMSMKEILGGTYDDSVNFFCFSGFCDTGLLLPLIFTFNSSAGTLGVEHTFAPFLYGSSLFGPTRREIDRQIKRSRLFEKTVRH
jgi:hypothetical protein